MNQGREGEPPENHSEDTEALLTRTFAGSASLAPEHPAVWGHFRDLRPIGSGGFGAVYRAWDTQLHRDVALKLLMPRGDAEDDQSAALQEARMMARVRHPNIVPVYGVAATEGRVGFWSELIEGPSLASIVKSSGPMDPRAAAEVVAELCKAIAALHAAGILHRDIKAENALREPGGRVLLMDFGLSRDPSKRFFGGTIPYMAPELFEDAPGSPSATPATDIYALGVLLYFLVSAAFPLRQKPEDVRRPPKIGELRPLSEARPGLAKPFLDIVNRATAFQPETRFASAEGMLVALDAYLASTRTPKPSAAGPKRLRLIAVVSVLLAALAVARFIERAHGPSTSTGAYALYQQAHALLERRDKPGNISAAADLFTRAIQADPKFALAHADLADAFWEQFRQTRDPALKARASAEAERALELDRELPQAFLVEGRIHEGTGQSGLAMADFRRALELDARNANVYRELGQMYDSSGRNADADTAYQKAIDLDPNNWRNYNSRGLWLLDQGRVDEAAVLFEKELSVAPDNTWGINNLARARMRQGRLADARQLLERSSALGPDDPRTHNSLGFLLMQVGEFDAAAAQFTVTAKLDPGNYLSWANLASATEFGAGGLEEARPAYLKAIELAEAAHRENPSDAYLAASLGSFHAAVGDREKALALVRQAVALAPQDANVLEAAGEGYEILGLRDKAIPLIMEALSRGYPADIVKRSPDLKRLLGDPRFHWPAPAASERK